MLVSVLKGHTENEAEWMKFGVHTNEVWFDPQRTSPSNNTTPGTKFPS
jgi:hypothetical protein